MSAIARGMRFGVTAHLQLELLSHSIFFVSLDYDMEIVEVFNDEVVSLVHCQKDLLDRRIAYADVQTQRSVSEGNFECARRDSPSEKDACVSTFSVLAEQRRDRTQFPHL